MKTREEEARKTVERILGGAPDLPPEQVGEGEKCQPWSWRDTVVGALFAVAMIYGGQTFSELLGENSRLRAENAALTKELLNTMFTDIPASLPGADEVDTSLASGV